MSSGDVADIMNERRRTTYFAAALTAGNPVAGNLAVSIHDWKHGIECMGHDTKLHACSPLHAAVYVPPPLKGAAKPPNVADVLYGGVIPPGYDVNYHHYSVTAKKLKGRRAQYTINKNSTEQLYRADHVAAVGPTPPVIDVHAQSVLSANSTTKHIVWMTGIPNDPPSTSVDVPLPIESETDGKDVSLDKAVGVDRLTWYTMVDAAGSTDIRTTDTALSTDAHLALMVHTARNGDAAIVAKDSTTAGVRKDEGRMLESGERVQQPCPVTFIAENGVALKAVSREVSPGARIEVEESDRPHMRVSVL